LLTRAAPYVISAALRVLSWTLRVQMFGVDELKARVREGERIIVAFWHNRVMVMPLAARGLRMCIMNSRSRDGEIATRALRRWGIHSVRGSASRGAVAGFLQLVRAFREGYNLAIVPDGPRGPCCRAKKGVGHLARVTGAPVFPVSYAASRSLSLRSWDRLVVPLPFSRVVLLVGEAVSVPRDADRSTVEGYRREIERRLNAAGAAATARLRARRAGEGSAG